MWFFSKSKKKIDELPDFMSAIPDEKPANYNFTSPSLTSSNFTSPVASPVSVHPVRSVVSRPAAPVPPVNAPAQDFGLPRWSFHGAAMSANEQAPPPVPKLVTPHSNINAAPTLDNDNKIQHLSEPKSNTGLFDDVLARFDALNRIVEPSDTKGALVTPVKPSLYAPYAAQNSLPTPSTPDTSFGSSLGYLGQFINPIESNNNNSTSTNFMNSRTPISAQAMATTPSSKDGLSPYVYQFLQNNSSSYSQPGLSNGLNQVDKTVKPEVNAQLPSSSESESSDSDGSSSSSSEGETTTVTRPRNAQEAKVQLYLHSMYNPVADAIYRERENSLGKKAAAVMERQGLGYINGTDPVRGGVREGRIDNERKMSNSSMRYTGGNVEEEYGYNGNLRSGNVGPPKGMYDYQARSGKPSSSANNNKGYLRQTQGPPQQHPQSALYHGRQYNGVNNPNYNNLRGVHSPYPSSSSIQQQQQQFPASPGYMYNSYNNIPTSTHYSIAPAADADVLLQMQRGESGKLKAKREARKTLKLMAEDEKESSNRANSTEREKGRSRRKEGISSSTRSDADESSVSASRSGGRSRKSKKSTVSKEKEKKKKKKKSINKSSSHSSRKSSIRSAGGSDVESDRISQRSKDSDNESERSGHTVMDDDDFTTDARPTHKSREVAPEVDEEEKVKTKSKSKSKKSSSSKEPKEAKDKNKKSKSKSKDKESE